MPAAAPDGRDPAAPFHFVDGIDEAMAKAQEPAGERRPIRTSSTCPHRLGARSGPPGRILSRPLPTTRPAGARELSAAPGRLPAMSDSDFTPLRVTHRTLGPGLEQVRDWARQNGHPVGERGRIDPGIIEAFHAAHPGLADTFEMVRATARTPGARPEDHAWQDAMGDIYTVAFVRGLDEREVLRRLGASERDVRMIGEADHTRPEGPRIVTVRRIGDWTVSVEDCGWRALRPDVLSALSRNGGEVVAVLRHDYAQHELTHAADGRTLTIINPAFPIDRQGEEPDRLNRYLRELGIDPAAADHVADPVPVALALAARITGVMLTPEDLRRPVLGAALP